jgi:type I restriction enzyme R subunit
MIILLSQENINKADHEKLKQASKSLLASLQKLIKPMPNWPQNTQTQAEVKMFILDHLWQLLPRPPFSEADAETLTERIYDHVWQQSARGNLDKRADAA